MQDILHGRTRLRATRIELAGTVRWWLDEQCWAELAPDQALERRLAEADGWCRAEQLARGLDATGREQLGSLLQLMHRAGLAVEGRPEAVPQSLRVGLVGSGVLARSVATSLVRSGVRSITCLDERSPDPLVWPGTRQLTGSAALARSLRPRHGLRVGIAHGVRELAELGTDIVVVAAGTLEPDRLLLGELVEHGLGHLVLGAHQDTGRIGPLVLPGRTPCLQCHDLARAEQDPAWGLVLAQLCQVTARPHPTIGQVVATRAALELGWAGRDLTHGERLHGRCELHDLERPTVRDVRFSQHPGCSCARRP
ncbi:hypothetical protein [Luteococcus peritonei]|uniref:THIF-type NAD/FAD binding fold domain-containing protein n=1 Tax=Luteococcus peritonei TaxID=88874 RepID=A0ABW4RZB8_9ACTN